MALALWIEPAYHRSRRNLNLASPATVFADHSLVLWLAHRLQPLRHFLCIAVQTFWTLGRASLLRVDRLTPDLLNVALFAFLVSTNH